MKRMIAGFILLAILPTMALAQTSEVKVDEATVVGTARRIPTATTSSPTTYGAPAARPADPGLPPERSLEPTRTTTAPTRLESQRQTEGTPGRSETKSRTWLWVLLGAAVIGGIAAAN
jgi:hypothetical protein